MEDVQENARQNEQGYPSTLPTPSEINKNKHVPVISQNKSKNNGVPSNGDNRVEHPTQNATQILWTTGTLSEPIPNGFYSVAPVRLIYSDG